MSKHRDHALSECPDPDFCEMKMVWRITNNRTGTSHVMPDENFSYFTSLNGRVVLIGESFWRSNNNTWEKI